VKEKPGKKVIDIPEQSRQIEDQDEEFFEGDEVGDFSFLRKLDVKELGKRVEKEKIQREERTVKSKAPVSESEDDYSDEEGLSDVLSDALDEKSAVKVDWDEEQAYESKPRMGDSQWRKKESTKLPIRTANGGIKQIDASDSESDSSDEAEESDSDSEAEEAKEQAIVEEPVKMGPEAVIEAKEALARLAEEILELPEERVIASQKWANSGSKSERVPRNIQQGKPDYQKVSNDHPANRLQRYYPWVQNSITLLIVVIEYALFQKPRKQPKSLKKSNNSGALKTPS
jgi:hypothetical protein